MSKERDRLPLIVAGIVAALMIAVVWAVSFLIDPGDRPRYSAPAPAPDVNKQILNELQRLRGQEIERRLQEEAWREGFRREQERLRAKELDEWLKSLKKTPPPPGDVP